MKVASKHSDVGPEHCECTPDVHLEVRHEEAICKGVVGQSVRIKVGMDDPKEDIISLPAFVRQRK